MARLGAISPLPWPVDVAIRYHFDQLAHASRWSIRSLDVYGEDGAACVERRILFSSDDPSAVLTYLEGGGYVRADDRRHYRLHDVTCGRCGAYVPPVVQPCPAEGWHGGREYRRFGGGLQILRVRCQAHPFDVEEEARELSAAGLL